MRGGVKRLVFRRFADVESVTSFLQPGTEHQGNKVGEVGVKRLDFSVFCGC